jgi:multidrug efflux pump subunit AcrB
MLAVVLVIVLVGLFMGARNGLIVGATVALSIVLTIGIMPLVGVDINQISLLALIVSLGIVVDAGIVAIDSIENHLRAGSDRRTAAWMGLHVLRLPLLTSTLVAMSSFFPFRFMGGGSTGDFVAALGIVTTAALAISLLVAYFVTPILGEWFAAASDLSSVSPVERAVRRPFEALLAALQRWYVPLATASLRRPGLTVAIAVVLTVLAVAAMPLLGIQFFPSADRNQFVITVNAAEGTDLRTTARFVERIEARLRGRPGLLTYGAFIGASAPRFYYNLFPEQPKPSYAEIIVNTVDVATTNRLVGELGGEFERTLPGVRVEVKPFQQGPPVGTPIQIRLTGSDRAELAWFAERIRGVLAGVPGAAHVRDSLGVPTTRIGARIDEDRAALAGVSDVSIQQLLALAYGGETATDIRGNDRETPVVVRLPEALRGTLDTVDALSVRNDAGAPVPLSEVVTTQLQTQTSVSTMRDGMPTVTVLAEARDRMPSAVLADFRARFAAFPIPPGVSIVYAGENEEIETSFRNLAIALGIGLLINQTILLWEFRQLRVSLVVLSAVPLGLVGAVFGLAVTDSPLGFVGALGIASLGGIVTNHAIVLFEYAKRERAAGLPMERALIVAGSKRLRPIMLTVLAAVAGLLPLAFSGQTLWRPFCWAIAFGLGNSMLMTLIAIPAVYRFVCGRGERTRDVPANGLHAKTREVALTEMPTS